MNKHLIVEIDPTQAQSKLRDNTKAVLIDVRSRVEFEFVGHPVDAVHVAWKEFPGWQENADFVAQVEQALSADGPIDHNRPLFMICRSGARSMAAARKLATHGYTDLYNVTEGFEGDKNDNGHRNTVNGWRFRDLPWEQT